jgi:hypothetical protein
MKLSHQVAIVTGAGRNIGEEISSCPHRRSVDALSAVLPPPKPLWRLHIKYDLVCTLYRKDFAMSEIERLRLSLSWHLSQHHARRAA